MCLPRPQEQVSVIGGSGNQSAQMQRGGPGPSVPKLRQCPQALPLPSLMPMPRVTCQEGPVPTWIRREGGRKPSFWVSPRFGPSVRELQVQSRPAWQSPWGMPGAPGPPRPQEFKAKALGSKEPEEQDRSSALGSQRLPEYKATPCGHSERLSGSWPQAVSGQLAWPHPVGQSPGTKNARRALHRHRVLYFK